MDHNQFYSLAGQLRDIALLCPGMKTALLSTDFPSPLNFSYAEGLRSYLYEEDYTRFPLDDRVFALDASTAGMKVLAYFRRVHAGTARVKSFVNYYPSQGGAHLEGLAAALSEIWGDDQGCRTNLFVTNPDTNSAVKLPFPFLGAMHLKLDAPRYYGPTKDVLFGDDVRGFIYQTALTELKPQWKAWRERK